jgi:hypothetical protein
MTLRARCSNVRGRFRLARLVGTKSPTRIYPTDTRFSLCIPAEPRRRLKEVFLLGLASVAVGIGAGIGAGYGIWHENESYPSEWEPSADVEQWLLVMNADNGTLTLGADGRMEIGMNYLRERVPSFTNVPKRLATLAPLDTAFDFIAENIARDQGANVILSYMLEDKSTRMIPLTLDRMSNVTGDSATFGAGLQLSTADGTFEGLTVPMDEVNLFVISSENPSSVEFPTSWR